MDDDDDDAIQWVTKDDILDPILIENFEKEKSAAVARKTKK